MREAGDVPIGDWAGYEPVAVLALEPHELAAKGNLSFRESYDDLDYLTQSSFRGSFGNLLGLVRHRGAPTPGTELLVKAANATDRRRQFRDALRCLRLSESDVTWVSSKLRLDAKRSRQKTAKRARSGVRAKGSRKVVRGKGRKRNPSPNDP